MNETFGKVVMAVMAMPRYPHQQIGDLAQLVLDPMLRDRIAIAQPTKPTAEAGCLTGIAIWASVSEAVDAKIREQIKAGVFPIKLHANDWNSGPINWPLDVIAPNPKAATAVLMNFKQVVKEGDLRMHPLVGRLIEPEVLERVQAGTSEMLS